MLALNGVDGEEYKNRSGEFNLRNMMNAEEEEHRQEAKLKSIRGQEETRRGAETETNAGVMI